MYGGKGVKSTFLEGSYPVSAGALFAAKAGKSDETRMNARTSVPAHVVAPEKRHATDLALESFVDMGANARACC